jgi:hypothetical protein
MSTSTPLPTRKTRWGPSIQHQQNQKISLEQLAGALTQISKVLLLSEFQQIEYDPEHPEFNKEQHLKTYSVSFRHRGHRLSLDKATWAHSK